MAGHRTREVAVVRSFVVAIAAAYGLIAAPHAPSFALCAAVGRQVQPSLPDVLASLHAYLADYAKHLPAMIATEHYEQRVGAGRSARTRRLLVSDFGLVQVPGDAEWLGFREVLKVDGKPVADSAQRLSELLSKPSRRSMQQARLIAEESARFNIGPVVRTINDPAFVLELLDGRHKQQMTFTKTGEEKINGTPVWVLKFIETARPTITRTRDLTDLPAEGKVWVEPASGRVRRADASVEPGYGVTASITVLFEHDEAMGFAVPQKMTERYTNRNLITVSSGEATYRNYRRFTVQTQEDLRLQ